eukprot:6198403-Pleurochrysis_carterae.AAC.3
MSLCPCECIVPLSARQAILRTPWNLGCVGEVVGIAHVETYFAAFYLRGSFIGVVNYHVVDVTIGCTFTPLWDDSVWISENGNHLARRVLMVLAAAKAKSQTASDT